MSDSKKPVIWMGSSRKDLKAFPRPVRRDMGQALYAAQRGETHPTAKPLKGFAGRSVLEIVAPYDTDTYRAVYTVRIANVVYVLHAFQKKSKKGVRTPRKEIVIIKQRLKDAERINRDRKN